MTTSISAPMPPLTNPESDSTNPNNWGYAPVEDGHIPLTSIAAQAAKSAGIPVELFLNQINQESSFDPNAKNGNATGIAQFMPATAKERGVDPTDPYKSLYGAASYLNDLHDQHGTWEDALKHYGTIGKNGPANDGQANLLSIAQKYDQKDADYKNPANWGYENSNSATDPTAPAMDAMGNPVTDPTKTSTLGAAAAGFGMGAVPFGNRALAAVQSLGPSHYQNNLDDINKYLDTAKSEHPIAYTAGEIGGNAADAALLPGAGALASVAKFGTLGALQGAAQSSDLSNGSDVAKNAAEGALLGAGTSALGQGAGAIIGGAGRIAKSGLNSTVGAINKGVEKAVGSANAPLLEGAIAGSMHGLTAPLLKLYGGALAADKGGRVLSIASKYAGDPGGMLQALQGTRYYKPVLEAMTTSPGMYKGLITQLVHQDPEFRDKIGYSDATNE